MSNRLTLKGNYTEPTLPFSQRMAWLARVQRLAAEFSRRREPYPHKVLAVARTLALIGPVCRLSYDCIADRAGCVPKTAQAAVRWLEAQGCLTWSRTARRHANGRMVRSSNLYTLVAGFAGLVASLARFARPTWRDRPAGQPAEGNEVPGMPRLFSYEEQKAAQASLSEITKQRQALQLTDYLRKRGIPAA